MSITIPHVHQQTPFLISWHIRFQPAKPGRPLGPVWRSIFITPADGGERQSKVCRHCMSRIRYLAVIGSLLRTTFTGRRLPSRYHALARALAKSHFVKLPRTSSRNNCSGIHRGQTGGERGRGGMAEPHRMLLFFHKRAIEADTPPPLCYMRFTGRWA